MSITHPDNIQAPTLGPEGDHCAGCGGALAPDQRYCLNCGRARTEARLDVVRELGLAPAPAAAAVATGPSRQDRQMLIAGLVVLAVLVAAAIGVLIGRSGQQQTASQPAPVVNITGGVTGGATAASGVTDSWPEGSTGWTVQLQTLPDSASAADVQAAVADAAKKGADEPATLVGDDHEGTPAGRYVIFSGVFATRKEASAALKDLGSDKFPNAKLLHVTDGGTVSKESGGSGTTSDAPTVSEDALEQQQNLSGQDYVDESKKLPDELGTDGEAPPTDNKAPGGGTEATEIG